MPTSAPSASFSHVTDAYLAIGTGVAVEALRRKVVRPEQLVTIGPAVEPASVTASPASRARARALLGLPADATVVGTVGRMDFQKAPEVMLEALARMATPAVLVWVGGGPLLEDTARRAQASGLERRVLLLGHRTDVAELLPAFDVFAMSSRYEGLPCAIVEAQACGIPVVATSVNAVSDVVVPGVTGLLVAPQDPDQLARALDHALTHPRQAAAWAERATAQLGTRYDASTLGATLQEVYTGDPEVRRPLLARCPGGGGPRERHRGRAGPARAGWHAGGRGPRLPTGLGGGDRGSVVGEAARPPRRASAAAPGAWRTRLAREAGLVVDRELVVLPGLRTAAFVVEDSVESLTWFWNAFATVPPGRSRGSR